MHQWCDNETGRITLRKTIYITEMKRYNDHNVNAQKGDKSYFVPPIAYEKLENEANEESLEKCRFSADALFLGMWDYGRGCRGTG